MEPGAHPSDTAAEAHARTAARWQRGPVLGGQRVSRKIASLMFPIAIAVVPVFAAVFSAYVDVLKPTVAFDASHLLLLQGRRPGTSRGTSCGT